MTRPNQDHAAPDAASRVEAIAVEIRALAQAHGSPELTAAALALVETVRSELREPERGPDGSTSGQRG